MDKSLEFWKDGNPFGNVTGFDVPIYFQDVRWQTGKKLESYEILGEEESKEGPKVFLVKLKLDSDSEPVEGKFYVFGKDPMQVFAEKDYAKATGTGG